MRTPSTAGVACLVLIGIGAAPAIADQAPGPSTPPVAPPVSPPASPPVAPPPPPPAIGRIEGRVIERATTTPVPGAEVSFDRPAGARPPGGPAEVATLRLRSDDEGRFEIELPPGDWSLVIAAAGYEPLAVIEPVIAGVRRTLQYRLLPQPDHARRYRSTVRGSTGHTGDHVALRAEDLQGMAGTGGDALRVISALPGVVQLITLLPIYSVRGASPGMTGFLLDGMRVPQLFHNLVIEPVVHADLYDRIDFYPGSYDVTFGHVAGGVIDVGTRPARRDAPYHAEVELKLWDATSLVEARLPGGASIVAAGRYGNPGFLIGLLQPGVGVEFGDYQLRLDWKGLTVEAIGSSDSVRLDLPALGSRAAIAGQQLTAFHRLQVRERARLGRVDVEAAIVGGIDRFAVLSGQGVQKLALSARLQARVDLPVVNLQVGLDAEVSRFRAEQFSSDATSAAPDALGELAGDRDGLVAGAYAQAIVDLRRFVGRPLSVAAGVRADVYHAGGATLLGIDPRLTLRFEPLPQVELFGGVGLYQQPPSFPVPLPGLDTYALRLGLQRALQWSAGATIRPREAMSLKVTAYYSRFQNMNDIVIDYVASACSSPPPESLTGIAAYVTRQVEGTGMGLEVLLRGVIGPVSGWLAYTLSRAERQYLCGLGPADIDQTHTFKALLRARLPWRLVASAQLTVASGKPYTRLGLDASSGAVVGYRNNARLPDYAQLDLRIEREWIFQRWALLAYLEAWNVTASQSNLGVTYDKDPVLMVTRYDRPVIQGFQWVLPSIGLRARF